MVRIGENSNNFLSPGLLLNWQSGVWGQSCGAGAIYLPQKPLGIYTTREEEILSGKILQKRGLSMGYILVQKYTYLDDVRNKTSRNTGENNP